MKLRSFLFFILAPIVLLAAVLFPNATLATSKARKLVGDHPTFTLDQLRTYGQTFSRMLRCAMVAVPQNIEAAAGRHPRGR